MKIFDLPDECPTPEIDYQNYDSDKALANERAHQDSLKVWLQAAGYGGKLTGEVVSFPVADGHARYMVADGRSTVLIHLPYGDAYEYPDAQFLPKKEIVKRIEANKSLACIFGKGS